MNPLKKLFPIFSHYSDMIYFDNAATTHMPAIVCKNLYEAYKTSTFPISRSRYRFAENTTEEVQRTKNEIAFFAGTDAANIAFISSSTLASYVVMQGLKENLTNKSHILIATDAHHSLSGPWINYQQTSNFTIDWLHPLPTGEFNIEGYAKILKNNNCQYVLLNAMSHIYGYKVNLIEVIQLAHTHGARIILDASQYAAHDYLKLDKHMPDACFFSSHKMYGPLGIACLYISPELQDTIRPTIPGGGALQELNFNECIYKKFPESFEAGSINSFAIFGFLQAIKFIHNQSIFEYEKSNFPKMISLINELLIKKNYRIISSSTAHSIVSFYHEEIHAHDIADILSTKNICVRSGHLCSHTSFANIPPVVRLSLGCYNDYEEINALIQSLP